MFKTLKDALKIMFKKSSINAQFDCHSPVRNSMNRRCFQFSFGKTLAQSAQQQPKHGPTRLFIRGVNGCSLYPPTFFLLLHATE